MTSTASIPAEWRAAFDAADWRVTGRVDEFEGGYDESSKMLRLHLSDAANSPFIDLPACPAENVEIHLIRDNSGTLRTPSRNVISVQLGSAFRELTVVTGTGTRESTFKLSENTPLESLAILPGPTTSTAGEIRPAWRRTISITPGPTTRCAVRHAKLFLRDTGLTIPEVRLEDADVELQVVGIDHLKLSGVCRVITASLVERLEAQPDTLLEADIETSSGLLTVDGLAPSADHLTLGSGVTLRVKQLSGGTMRLRSGSVLEILRSAEDASVVGPGALHLKARSWAQGFQMLSADVDDTSLSPLLVLDDSAVFRQATGSVRLGPCMNAQIEGDEAKGLLICGVDSAQDGDRPLLGAVIRSVTFPVELESLPIIGTLQTQCAVAVPLVTPLLPGQSTERANAKHRNLGYSNENMRADFATSLSRLAETKGAPPSTRTRIAWLDYRMRLSQAKGAEKWILWGYRSIGFGERAGPPSLFFVVLCCVFAGIQLDALRADLACDSIIHFADAAFKWAISPLHLISGEGNSNDPAHPHLVAAARAILAVVFGTAALALRKYVKREGQPPA